MDRVSAEDILNMYGDMLYRTAFSMLFHHADAQDAVQDTLIRYMQKQPAFKDEEHRKAWLLRVVINRCRDLQRKRSRTELMEDLQISVPDEHLYIFETLAQIPAQYREVLILHSLYGYTDREIARMIGRTPSAVRMRLKKARELFREVYDDSEQK